MHPKSGQPEEPASCTCKAIVRCKQAFHMHPHTHCTATAANAHLSLQQTHILCHELSHQGRTWGPEEGWGAVSCRGVGTTGPAAGMGALSGATDAELPGGWGGPMGGTGGGAGCRISLPMGIMPCPPLCTWTPKQASRHTNPGSGVCKRVPL